MNVSRVEGVGIAIVLGRSLHHYVVLVQRGVNGRYLRFAELVIQGLIDELGGYAEASRGSPVVVQEHLHAAVLLIGGDVLDLRHLQHLFVDQRSPGGEVAHRIGRDLILVLRVALSSSDTNVLRSLQKGGSSRQRRKFGTKSI